MSGGSKAPTLAAAAAAAANLLNSRGVDAAMTQPSDQLHKRVTELELELAKATAAKKKLEVHDTHLSCLNVPGKPGILFNGF